MTHDEDGQVAATGSKLWTPELARFTCENGHTSELDFWQDDTGVCPQCGAETLDVTLDPLDLHLLRELLRGMEYRVTAIDGEESPGRRYEMIQALFDELKGRIDRGGAG